MPVALQSRLHQIEVFIETQAITEAGQRITPTILVILLIQFFEQLALLDLNLNRLRAIKLMGSSSTRSNLGIELSAVGRATSSDASTTFNSSAGVFVGKVMARSRGEETAPIKLSLSDGTRPQQADGQSFSHHR